MSTDETLRNLFDRSVACDDDGQAHSLWVAAVYVAGSNDAAVLALGRWKASRRAQGKSDDAGSVR